MSKKRVDFKIDKDLKKSTLRKGKSLLSSAIKHLNSLSRNKSI